MNKNNFKDSLKVDTNKIENISSNNNNYNSNLLEDLGLFNIPKNVNVSISDDNKYLDLQLSNTNKQKNQHLLFQLPLHENDFSCLKNRPDYQDIINRYYAYTKQYIDEIKDYAIQEGTFLKNTFPDLVFTIKIRTKSFESYITKTNHNIYVGKSPYINDIIAERIIITSYKGSTDENVLIDMCDNVAKALYDFRINTHFRMKNNIERNPSNSDKDYLTRDYIHHPKANGYQSLHIQMENIYNSDLNYETQIRTFFMESQSKSSNEIAHNVYKPRLLNDLSANRVPSYSVVTPFTDSFNNVIIYDVPFKNRFYHYYNSSLNNHELDSSKRTVPITYDNYKKELYTIEKSLGMTFKDLRKRIRDCKTLNNESFEYEQGDCK